MPQLETTEPTVAYELAGVLWVPHYRLPLVYVAPGGVTATQDQLLAQGATERIEQLWERAQCP